MEREDLVAGGVDITRTRAALIAAWNREHQSRTPREVLLEHAEHRHGLGDEASLQSAPRDRERILGAIRGCRACGLARALIRCHRYETEEHSLVERARILRNNWNAWKQFQATFEAVDDAPPSPLVDAFSQVAYWLDLYSFPLENAPKAMAELDRGAGRSPALLRRELVSILHNAGIRFEEMADLIDDALARETRPKRLMNDLRTIRKARRAKKTTSEPSLGAKA